MGANTFGSLFKCHAFGESHGPALGVVIEGCPAGVPFLEEILKRELNRRRPGRWPWASPRREPDRPEILSGVFEGKTLGTPIGIVVYNKDTRSEDYREIKKNPRPGHSDDLWREKFQHSDHRGGGRASGRETLGRVLAGAVARMALNVVCPDFRLMAFVRRIGPIELKKEELGEAEKLFSESCLSEEYPACFPHKEKSRAVVDILTQAQSEGESLGAVVELWMAGLPSGLGQPVFYKFKADLASAFLGIGASFGFLVGNENSSAGFSKGTDFHKKSANYGGLRGGLTTGETVKIQILFKPPSSIKEVALKGRHDPCVGPRAVAVVEAMACLVVLDHLLWKRLDRIKE